MTYFDSHCHLDMEPLSSEREGAIERAAKAGVLGMINVGASIRGSKASVDLANSYPNIWASVGMHPHDAETTIDLEGAIETLRQLAASDKVIAIGEIGLDYFSTDGTLSAKGIEDQKRLFCAQLDLARELGLPVIFHVRDAWDDFFEIVSGAGVKKGVVHCFTADLDIVKKVLDLGLSVGFTGFITFEQSKFDHIRKAAQAVPLDRLLIETDAPFLAPEPHRGKTNEPAYVVEVAKKIAQLKGVEVETVVQKTTENVSQLFGL